LLGSAARGVLAQPVIPLTLAYPTRSLRLVVPAPRGSIADMIARAIAPSIAKELGFDVHVENRAGDGGNDGAGLVANGAADGHTLLLGALTTHAIRGALFVKTAPFDVDQSFAAVAILGSVPRLLLAHRDVAATTLGELLTRARSRPGGFSFASGGEGGIAHMAGELLQTLAGIRLRHEVRDGPQAALRSVVAGEAHLIVAAANDALPHVEAGALRALAVAGHAQVAQLPDVPTSARAGLDGFDAEALYSLMVPAGTPDAALARLNGAARAAMDKPEVREALRAGGAVPSWTTLAEAQSAMRAESAKWKKLVRDARLQGR
jgi:tripartite-type tricarboxylate transporter receptor subunit TctC